MSWWKLSEWQKQIQASRAKQRRREKPMFPKARLYVEQLEKRWLMSNNIVEYTIPTSGVNPSELVTGSDNNLWVTWGSPNNPLLKVSPVGSMTAMAGGTITFSSYDVSGPGGLWYTGIQPSAGGTGPQSPGGTSGLVGLMTTTGTDTQYILANSNDPRGITVGPDGNLWFTEHDLGKIAKITTSGTVTEYAIPTANSGPQDITLGANNELWFTESTANKIGEVTTGGSFTEFAVPTSNSNPYDITEGADGNIWFTENNGVGKIGRSTRTGTITEFSTQLGLGRPTGINSGPDGNLWFTEYTGNNIDRITPYGSITAYAVPTANSGPGGVSTGPDGSIWFTEQSVGKVAKITDVLALGGGALANPTGGAVPTPVGETPPYPVDGTNTDPAQGTSVQIGELSVAPGSGDVGLSHGLDCFLSGGS
jgi:streptogramin lyase